MNFEIESAALIKGLSCVQRIIGKSSASQCVIEATAKRGIRLSGETIEGARKFALYLSDCEVKKRGSVTVDPVVLSTALTGKGVVSLISNPSSKNASNTLKVKSLKGRYSGALTLLPPTKVEISIADSRTLGGELKKTLFEMLPRVSLTSQFVEGDMLAHIRMDKKGITVGCFDHYHGALSVNTEGSAVDSAFEFKLPLHYVEILRGLPSDNLKLSIDSSSVTVFCREYELRLPLVQTEARSLDELEQLLSIMGDEKASFECSRDALVVALKGQTAVYESSTSTVLHVGKSGITVETKSSYGNIREGIKVTTKGETKILFQVPQLLDMLPLCSPTIVFKIMERVFVIEDAETNTTYLGSTF